MKGFKTLPIIIAIVSIFYTGCKPSDCSEMVRLDANRPNRIEPPVCIVLCDFSASLDTESVNQVKAGALKIFDRYYGRKKLQFYPINRGSEPPMFETDGFVFDSTSAPSQQVQVKRCYGYLKPECRHQLGLVLDHQSQTRPRETYIIQSLESAVKSIGIVDKKSNDYHSIFILSDMLEYGSSDFGSLNIESKPVEEGIDKLSQSKTANFPLVNSNTEIRVGLFSQSVNHPELLTTFWSQVFYRLGYRKPVALNNELGL